MKNRFLALILLIALLSTVIPAQAIEAKASPDDAVAFMNAMNFITEKESTEERLEEEISRIQFVSYLARILNINETSVSDMDYFYDVPSDHWGKYSLNCLVEQGIISVNEDRLFRPDDTITKTEAAVIAAITMGRGPEAVFRGGYPSGYIAIATEEKLFNGVHSGEELTLKAAVMFLYNMINAEIIQPAFPGEGGTYAKNGETILSEYHDIYYDEGIMNAVWGVSVDEKVAHREDEVIIGENTYTSEKWCYDYLGQKIKFFYRENDDEERELIYIFSDADEKNDVRYITSDDYLGYENHKIIYRGENGSKKSVSIDSGATVIRNGVNLSDNLETALSDFYGNMRVINSGKYQQADVVIIEDYINIVAESIVEDKKLVYDKYDPAKFVNLSDDSSAKIIILDAMDNQIGFDSIIKGAVLSVAQSADKSFTLARLNSGIIIGEIDAVEVGGEADTYLEIDGKKHNVLKSFYEQNNNRLVRGVSGTFKSDVLGKIAHFTVEKSGEMQYAYLIKMHVSHEIDDRDLGYEAAIFKLFTEDGVIEKVACREKVKIDGVQIKTTQGIVGKMEKDGVFSPCLVRVRYDDDGKIKEIDTKAKGTNESQYSLNLINPVNTNPLVYNTGLLDKDMYVSPTTKVMVVPKDVNSGAEDSYAMWTFSQVPRGNTLRVDLYQLDSESIDTDLVVYHREVNPVIDRWTQLYVVEKVTNELNGDDQQVIGLTLDATGNDEKFLVAESYVVKANSMQEVTASGEKSSGMNPARLDKGDIVRISLNYKNEITDIQLLFDYSIAEANSKASFFNDAVHPLWKISGGGLPGGFQYDVTHSYGYVARVSGNSFQWGYSKPGDINQIYNMEISKNTKLYVYDPDAEDKLTAGSIDDLIGYYQSPNNYSKIFTNTNGTAIKQCFIYK